MHRLSVSPVTGRSTLAALATILVVTGSCRPKYDYSGMEFHLVHTNGVDQIPIERVEVGDSPSLGFRGLDPGAPVEVFLNDDESREWSYARLFADQDGVIEPAILWYHTGVIGTSSRTIDFRPDPAFVTFDEAETYFRNHALTLSIRDLRGRELANRVLPLAPRSSPNVYPSNGAGVLVNAFDLMNDEVYVTGTHLPAGAVVHLFLVPNQRTWAPGDSLRIVTSTVRTIRLGDSETRFTQKLLDPRRVLPGGYDIVLRIGGDAARVLRPGDILSYNEDTALLMYMIINGNVVIESAGRMRSAPAKFEFSDSFEKNEHVYGAVDPSDVPASHPGGNYAAYYVVEHQPASYWDGAAPALTDVSGGVEIHRVKYWCINVSRRLIWPNATQPEPIEGYDVVVDFGTVPAMDAASFVADNVYNKGVDFIDGYAQEGFWVFEDPSAVGPYPVGQVTLDDPNGISGITGPSYPVTLAWARIMYPASSAGTGTSVSGTLPNYPVALFLHGRHWDCDYDGSGAGLSGGYTYPPSTCATANRIPSHEGYNYIMERLASQGIFSISISAHQIQHDNGAFNYSARGQLILKFLDKLRDWSDNGTDPFAGIFNGKLDLTRVALSGHSRGGEGVVAAQELNKTWPTPHGIVAVNAIAPTDQNGTTYLMTDASYYLLVGARDGDVATMQGFRTYDRAFPAGAPSPKPKMLAWVHGANHNYFNTIWTNAAALGSPNPWAGSVDDASGVTAPHVMSAAAQRQIALTTIAAFFRRHLQGLEPYKEIFTGRLKPAAMDNQHVYGTYQDASRKAIDDFEQQPQNAGLNSVGGMVTAPGFTAFAERLLNNSDSDYPPGFLTDPTFFHDALGLRLGWAAPQTYTTNLPAGHRDVTMYTHLTIRVAKKVTGTPTTGPGVNLLVNLEDVNGNKAVWDLRTDQFDLIPHPYQRSGGWCSWCTNQAQLRGVRIPLRNFTMNNSGVDLTNIVRITVRTEGAGEIGIDDIEFGR